MKTKLEIAQRVASLSGLESKVKTISVPDVPTTVLLHLENGSKRKVYGKFAVEIMKGL